MRVRGPHVYARWTQRNNIAHARSDHVSRECFASAATAATNAHVHVHVRTRAQNIEYYTAPNRLPAASAAASRRKRCEEIRNVEALRHRVGLCCVVHDRDRHFVRPPTRVI